MVKMKLNTFKVKELLLQGKKVTKPNWSSYIWYNKKRDKILCEFGEIKALNHPELSVLDKLIDEYYNDTDWRIVQ